MAAKKASNTVESYLAELEHPFKDEILALRQVLIGTDPSITEEIKWNAPSFRTSEHFATMQLRAKDALLLILHLGAKKRSLAASAIADPEQLLTWLGPDRASIRFAKASDVAARESALRDIVRQWIKHL